jgi:hypothetical protein
LWILTLPICQTRQHPTHRRPRLRRRPGFKGRLLLHFRQKSFIKESVKLALAVLLGLSIPGTYYGVKFYNDYKNEHAAELAAIQKPHDDVMAMLDNFNKNAKDLPRCP